MINQNSRETAIETARIIDEKKGENIKIYDLGGLSSICDYIIIATANSAPHLESLEQEASTRLKAEGIYKINRDGGGTGTWHVSDYGSFMLHIMTQETRDFYALDKIFSFGKEVNWQKPEVKKRPAKKTAAKTTRKPAVKKTVKKTAVKKTAKKPAAKKTAKTAKISSRKVKRNVK
jgi:ribosome-associated protein